MSPIATTAAAETAEKILLRFRNKKTRILVATDVAARGIDIGGLTHVINYSIPFDSSTYIHRIGRTGRAGSYGEAITLVRPEEKRKLEHLKSAIRKAVKGSLQEDTVPSVKKILELKQNRLFDSMKEAIWKQVDGVAVDGTVEGDLDSVASSEADSTSQENSIFARMAADLCGHRDPQEILASVLENFYGHHLDAGRYGHIESLESLKKGKGGRDSLREGGRRGRNADDGAPRRDRDVVSEDQKRLYVQLGRRDKFFVREIAEFFSDLLDIPQRQVDGIVVKDSFSLVSLPIEAAERALQMSQRDHSIPHMHLDEKPAGNGGGKRRSRGESEERDLPRSKPNRKKGKDNSEGSWSFKASENSSFDKSRSKGGKGSGRSFGGSSSGRFSEGKRKKGTVRGGSSASLYKRKLPQ